MYFEDNSAKYLKYCKEIRKHTPATIKNKTNSLGRFARWLNGREFNLENSRCYVDFLLEEGVSASTVKEYFRTIKAFGGYMDRYGIQPYFLKALELPKDVYRDRLPVSTETALKIIDAGTQSCLSDNKHGRDSKVISSLALRFMLFTGVRDGGLLNMKVSDVHFDTGTYHIRLKGGNIVEKGLPINLIEELKNIGSAYKLFPVSVETLRDVLSRGCKKLGLPKIKPHSLRSIFATTLASTDMSPIQLAKQMNHSKIETTYKHYIQSDVFKDTQILNLNHPIISLDVSPRKKLEMVEKSQIIMSLTNDPRFIITMLDDKLVIKIRRDY